MNHGTTNSSDPIEISNIFSDYFSSLYSTSQRSIPRTDDLENNQTNIFDYDLSLSEIFDGLSCLGNDHVPGPDNIPSLFLNKCHYVLTIPIHKLFILSLKSGIFLKMWKQSFITPIWKSRTKAEISNYRPVAKLSSLPKFLEKLVEKKLSIHFKHIFIDNQYGFRKSKSVDTNLVVFYSHLVNSVSDAKYL